MATTLSLTSGTAVVKPRILLGTVGGAISTAESDTGNALMLLITNPLGPKVEIVSCIGERSTGWLGRGRQRFTISMNGLPRRFSEDGGRCLAWVETTCLPALDGLIQLYVRDSNGEEWPLENPHRLLEIRDLLNHRR
jgi:hypothetical protein